MSNFFVFTKKEFVECWRTRKMLVLWLAFAVLGVMSPLFAKLTPEILKLAFDGELPLAFTEPTSADSWLQFYKNLNQIGIYLIVILFSGIVNREVQNGTLIPLVTKGLQRTAVILSKYCLMSVQWTLVLGMAFLITWGYTSYYFPDDQSPQLLAGLVALWIFGWLLLAVTLLMSTVLRSNYGSLIATILVIVCLYVLNLFEQVKFLNPLSLMTVNLALVKGEAQLETYLPALLLSGALTVLLLLAAISSFKRKKI